MTPVCVNCIVRMRCYAKLQLINAIGNLFIQWVLDGPPTQSEVWGQQRVLIGEAMQDSVQNRKTQSINQSINQPSSAKIPGEAKTANFGSKVNVHHEQ